MVAEHAVDRAPQPAAHAFDAVERGLEGAKGLAAVVAGQHAEIVTHVADQLAEPPHRDLVHVGVQIAEVQDGVAIETRRQLPDADVVVPDGDAFGVAQRAPVKSGQLQDGSNDRLRRIPVFQVEEGEALAELLGFVIPLNPQALPRMQGTEALLQFDQNVLVHVRDPWRFAPPSIIVENAARRRSYGRKTGYSLRTSSRID